MEHRCAQAVFLAWSLVWFVPAVFSHLKSVDDEDSGIRVQLTTIDSTLAGDVNLTFWLSPQVVNNTAQRKVIVNVFHYSYGDRKLLYTITDVLITTPQVVVLPCSIFDQPGDYRFEYHVSDSKINGILNQTLSLKWSKIRIVTPLNHTALTKFGSIWIYHNRKCLPRKYRDKVFLYYKKGKERVNITSKVVRKLQNGRQKKDGELRTRMSFSCELFDTQGLYYFEYVSMLKKGTFVLTRSKNIHVKWSIYSLGSTFQSILPCKDKFAVNFTAPECRRSTDNVELYQQNLGKFITKKPALPGLNTVSYPCSLFDGYVKSYCFKYVTKASFTKKKTVQTTFCLPTFMPGQAIYDGWSAWTSWGMCYQPCGNGKQYRYRFCLTLSTSHNKNDKGCEGRIVENRPCYVKACPETTASCSCGCIMTSREGMITSSPQLFPTLEVSDCEWRINVKNNVRIKLWFDVLKLEGDWVRIRDGNDSSAKELAYITRADYDSAIISSSNVMYINYHHNGKWVNGTRRGFTASYTTIGKVPTSSRSLSKLTFLGVFLMAVIVMGVVLFVVFRKLHQQHKLDDQRAAHTTGSTSTSESTLRSAGASSPLDEEVLSNEPLRGDKHFETKRHKRKRHRSSRGKEYVYDSKLARCSCAELSELESFSIGNSVAQSSGNSSNYSVNDCISTKCMGEESVEANNLECNCPKCFTDQKQRYSIHEYFGAPEKKYFGDWMVIEQDSYADTIWRHSYPRYV